VVTILKESKVRNLTKALAAVSLLVPASGHSLGIGDIKLHSALNQNLKAEIALVVSGNEDASDIKVRLAAPEVFDAQGVPWSYFLSKIKFKPEVKANGSVVIKLTSTEVLKEPFLDLLLEVTWPNGRLVREFTVLVDPPSSYPQATASSYKKSSRAASEEKSISAKKEVIKPAVAAPAIKATTEVVNANAAIEKTPPAAKIDALGIEPVKTTLVTEEKQPTAIAKPIALEKTKVAPATVDPVTDKDGAVKAQAPVVSVAKTTKETTAAKKPAKAHTVAEKKTPQNPAVSVVSEKPKTVVAEVKKEAPVEIKKEAPVEVKKETDKDGDSAVKVAASTPAADPVKITKEYGPTKKKTNLYRIAKEVNADSDISVEQMMLAIYKANPEAFYDDNMDSLRADQVLKIPSKESILKTESSEPSKNAAVAKPHKTWKKVTSTPKKEFEKSAKKQLRAKRAATKLTLRPPHEHKIAKTYEASPISAEEKLAEQESANKLSDTNQDLQIQLKKMQEQIATMKEILALKDKQLAALEKSLKTKTSDSEKTKPTKDEALLKAQKEAEAKVAELKAKSDAEAAKAKADAELKSKAEADAKAKAAAELKAKTDAELKADAEAAKGKTAAELKAKTEADAKTKVAADLKAKSDAELKAKADAEAAKGKTAAELKAKTEADAKTKVAADLKAKSDAELKAKADAEAAKGKTAAELKAKAEADAKAKNEAEAKLKAAADLKAKTDAELKAKAEAEAKLKAAADLKAKTDAELKAKAKAEAEAKLKAAADLKAKEDAALKAKAEAEAAKATADLKARAATTPQVSAPPPAAMAAHVAPRKKPRVIAPEPVAVEEDLLSDPYTLAVAGGGVFAAGLLGWLFWRKRKVEKSTEVESMFSENSEINLPEDEDEFSVAGIDDNSSFMFGGESSFLSDDNDFDAFEVDQDEVDPISEADVYLAYGRYQQAEELIRQAIIDLPDRDECKFKLLEIFCVNGNAKGFEEYVRELADAGKRSNRSFWSKVAEMGHEIIPNSPLLIVPDEDENATESQAINDAEVEDLKQIADSNFDADLSIFDSKEEAENKKTNDLDTKNTADDNGVDLSMFDPEPPKAVPVKEPEPPANNMDFDLSMFDEEPATKAVAEKEVESPANNVDFDLSMFDEEPAAEAVAEKEVEPPANNVDFDLSMFDEEPAAEAVAEKEVEPPANNVDFDLSMFDEEPAAEAVAEKEVEVPENNQDFDLSMFDEEPAAEAVAEKEVDSVNNVAQEFDLSLFDTESSSKSEVETTTEEFDLSAFDTEPSANAEPEEAEFDLSAFDAEPANTTKAAVEEFDLSAFDETSSTNTEAEVEFDLSAFDAAEPSTSNEEPEEVEFDLSAFNAEFGLPSESDKPHDAGEDIVFDLSAFDSADTDNVNDLDTPSKTFEFNVGGSAQDSEFADLDNMDVLETKLDLAMAFIDMGDLEAARAMAEKVLKEGTNEQKVVAQGILDSLS
jgi:pilus assembly protein FimV